MPYIRRVDLNNGKGDNGKNKPVHAWEIGIKIDF
jgi:hypothetical protein